MAGDGGRNDNGWDRDDEAHLEGLGERFQTALKAREHGDIDAAAELLRGILKKEPRLAEPRLELAHILLETGQVADAEAEAREALRILEAGGRWTDVLDDATLLSLAWGTLGEALRTKADSDEVVFGAPETFEALVNEARQCFDRALRLDPQNEHARAWSQSFGLAPRSDEE